MQSHLGVFYRSFKELGYCHEGLGVNATITGRVLTRHRVTVDVFGVRDGAHIAQTLRATSTITHVMIEAPWIPTADLAKLVWEFPRVSFVMRVHSQFGFLQVEAGAIRLIREQLDLQRVTLNFRVVANSLRFCKTVAAAYGADCLYIPNLYDCEHPHRRNRILHQHRLLRIASFGAIRLLKLHTTAAIAALSAARTLDRDLEFYINEGREENGKGVIQALVNLFAGLRWARLVQVPWTNWPQFRETIALMDACIQVSATETFNIVTADAACEGVPSVVSEAIEWVPKSWKVRNADDPMAISALLQKMIRDPNAGKRGVKALEEYVKQGLVYWKDWLTAPHHDHSRIANALENRHRNTNLDSF